MSWRQKRNIHTLYVLYIEIVIADTEWSPRESSSILIDGVVCRKKSFSLSTVTRLFAVVIENTTRQKRTRQKKKYGKLHYEFVCRPIVVPYYFNSCELYTLEMMYYIHDIYLHLNLCVRCNLVLLKKTFMEMDLSIWSASNKVGIRVRTQETPRIFNILEDYTTIYTTQLFEVVLTLKCRSSHRN